MLVESFIQFDSLSKMSDMLINQIYLFTRRACESLINCLPDILKDGSINSYLHVSVVATSLSFANLTTLFTSASVDCHSLLVDWSLSNRVPQLTAKPFVLCYSNTS